MFRQDLGSVDAEKQSDDLGRIREQVSDEQRRIGVDPLEQRSTQNDDLKCEMKKVFCFVIEIGFEMLT